MPCYPLCVEIVNKQGACVLKTRCRICHNLFSYHNNSWTYASNGILSHSTATPQDIVAATALVSECEANSEPFLVHKLPNLSLLKKEPLGNVALIRCTFAAPPKGPICSPTIKSSKSLRSGKQRITFHGGLWRHTCSG